jgi:hypothetical protein
MTLFIAEAGNLHLEFLQIAMAPFPTIKSKHSLVAKHVTEEVRVRYLALIRYIPN